MQNKKKRVAGLMLSMMYVLIYIFISILLSGVYLAYLNTVYPFKSNNEIAEILAGGSFALNVIACIVSLAIYLVIGFVRKKPLYKVIKNEKTPPVLSLMAVSCAVGSRFVVNVYHYISQKIPLLNNSIEKAEELIPNGLKMHQLLVGVFLMIVVAPIFEEILFRGIVFGELSSFMRPWAAIILQGLIFGIAHAALFQSIFAFVLGIILGIIYYYSKSIKMAFVYHIAFNASAFIITTQLSGISALIISILGVLLIVSSLIYIIGNSKKGL